MYVNIHFIAGTLGNFYPGDENVVQWNNGNWAANMMIWKANEYLSNILDNPIQPIDFLGDSRIRYEIYTEPSNPDDLYDGIWYWNEEPDVSDFPYGKKVVHIIVKDQATTNNGLACDNNLCNHLTLYNWYARSASQQINPYYDFSRYLSHELGHIAGLSHTFNCNNECNTDIDVMAECNPPGTDDCYAGVGNTDEACSAGLSGSNNIMGHNGNLRALSPCQWRLFYGVLATDKPTFVEVGNCVPGVSTSPIIISANMPVEWDTPQFIDSDVIIESGATLTISCTVYMGIDKAIEVRRGGKLIVQNGVITSNCLDERWAGIFVEGHPTKEQPDPFVPVSSYPDPDVAGVVLLINAELMYASTAVSTSRHNQGWLSNYWGGLVHAEFSHFVNNRRAVEFMRYNRANESRFEACYFVEEDDLVENSIGVTIWGAHAIEFKQCNFIDLDLAGISGYDFGAEVSSANTFSGNGKGIEIFNTYPLSAHVFNIGDATSAPNYFLNNRYGVYADATDLLSGLNVENNEFFHNFRSVYVEGEATYDVRHNSFLNTDNLLESPVTVTFWNTQGQTNNNFSCNVITAPGLMGVHYLGDNLGSQLKYNLFFGEPNISDAYVGAYGRIRNFQGAVGDPAANCFSTIDKSLVTNLVAEPFTYLVPEHPENYPNCIIVPDAYGNYDLKFTDDIYVNDCENQIITEPEISYQALLSKRQQLAAAQSNWQNNPSNLQLGTLYFEHLEDKETILKGLLHQSLKESNYSLAHQILLGESDERALRWRIGLCFEQGNWAKANQLIAQLPVATQEQQYFAEIMALNSKRLANGAGLIELTTEEETLLYEVAYSDYPSRCYARSILALLKGEHFEATDDFPEVEGISIPNPDHSNPGYQPYRAFPNPTDQTLELRYPISEQGYQLSLVNLSGSQTIELSVDGSGQFSWDVSGIPAGIYALSYYQDGRLLFQQKLTIIH
ncbi:MAG TPA: zinc-dependent metalloprotease [Saprospiraceae bacterium]|nr:zinc-dependent metalloprotease [Saprospiraceae bacterium]HMQ82251.1 zinc-dependent metalloprotease [Saprospiraceae bacterium]